MKYMIVLAILACVAYSHASVIGLGGLGLISPLALSPIGPSGIVTGAGAAGPSGIVTGAGAAGPSGIVTGAGAVGPTGPNGVGVIAPLALAPIGLKAPLGLGLAPIGLGAPLGLGLGGLGYGLGGRGLAHIG